MVKTEEIFHQKTDYKKIILRFLSYKYYFIGVAAIAVSIAFLMNRYVSKQYSNYTSILINKEQRNSFLSSDDIFQTGLFSGIDNVENELALLSSYPKVNRAVQEMNLEVSYFYTENFLPINFLSLEKATELYVNTPIRVIFDQTHVQPVNFKFFVEPLNDSIYKLSAHDESQISLYDYVANKEVKRIDSLEIYGFYRFGEKIVSPNYSFAVYLEDEKSPLIRAKKKLYFQFNDLV